MSHTLRGMRNPTSTSIVKVKSKRSKSNNTHHPHLSSRCVFPPDSSTADVSLFTSPSILQSPFNLVIPSFSAAGSRNPVSCSSRFSRDSSTIEVGFQPEKRRRWPTELKSTPCLHPPSLPCFSPPPPCDAYRLGHRGALTQETGERRGKDISETESRSTNVWGSSPCQFPQNLDFCWPKTTVCKYQVH